MPTHRRIEITFDEIYIEDSPNCTEDQLTILNGKERESLSLGSYCGNQLPAIITSSTEIVTIKFISDDAVNNTGFSLHYRGLAERNRGKYMKFVNDILFHLRTYSCV